MELLVANYVEASSGRENNKLKAAIRRNAVLLDDEPAQGTQVLNKPLTLKDSRKRRTDEEEDSCESELHPYVSCLLFFEEDFEVEYEEQIEHLHHIFQRNGIPEGLVATSIPNPLETQDETESRDQKMILQCIEQKINKVPVLALWEMGQARESINQQRDVQALREVRNYNEQRRFSDIGEDYTWQHEHAQEWYLLGTPLYPWNKQRLKRLAAVVLQGDPLLVAGAIPRNVFAVLDKSDSGDTLRCACLLCCALQATLVH